jgi:hypothetical protein
LPPPSLVGDGKGLPKPTGMPPKPEPKRKPPWLK